jgi:hypothetical protein
MVRRGSNFQTTNEELAMIELTKTKIAMADEIVRLRRALTWAWLAIAALSLTAIGACLVAWEVAKCR